MGVLAMKTDRLMAFTDAVLAIVITIMVIDLHVPATDAWQEIEPLIPLLVAYALAFINIGIFWIELELILAEGTEWRIRAVVGSRMKEWVSFCLYGLGIPAAFISPWIAVALYIAVSLMWLVPDRRFERWHNLQQSEAHPKAS